MAKSGGGKHGTSDEFCDPYCDICSEGKKLNVKSDGYCNDCYNFLCPNCLLVHSSLPFTSGHEVHRPKSQADKPSKFEHCDVHQGRRKDRFCGEHRALICKMCVPLHHKGCHVEFVKDVAKSIPSSEIDLLYDSVNEFKTQLLSTNFGFKGRNAADLREQRNKMLKEIQEMHDKTQSKLDVLFQDLRSDFDPDYHSQSPALSRDQKK